MIDLNKQCKYFYINDDAVLLYNLDNELDYVETPNCKIKEFSFNDAENKIVNFANNKNIDSFELYIIKRYKTILMYYV